MSTVTSDATQLRQKTPAFDVNACLTIYLDPNLALELANLICSSTTANQELRDLTAELKSIELPAVEVVGEWKAPRRKTIQINYDCRHQLAEVIKGRTNNEELINLANQLISENFQYARNFEIDNRITIRMNTDFANVISDAITNNEKRIEHLIQLAETIKNNDTESKTIKLSFDMCLELAGIIFSTPTPEECHKCHYQNINVYDVFYRKKFVGKIKSNSNYVRQEVVRYANEKLKNVSYFDERSVSWNKTNTCQECGETLRNTAMDALAFQLKQLEADADE